MSKRQSSALAITALVVAVLGWTPLGEAARTVVFPANSVGTAQLKTGAVTSKKIRDAGKTVIGGGASITRLSGPGLGVALTGSHPGDGTWVGAAKEIVETDGSWSVDAWAICAVTS